MLDDNTKLLITSYVDGELTPDEVASLKELLEWSSDARDYLQGQLLVARRLRQALKSDPPPVSPISRPIASQLLIQAAQDRKSRNQTFWPGFALVLTAAGLILWVGISGFLNPETKSEKVAEFPKAPAIKPVIRAGEGGTKTGVNPQESLAKVVPSESNGFKNPDSPEKETNQGNQPKRDFVQSGSFGGDKLENPNNPLETGEDILFGAPLAPSLTLKKVDLFLPKVIKIKELDPSFFLESESRGPIRIDLPTYQELEGVKRVIKTLQAEGCRALYDPGTEDRLKKNLPLGPVILTIHGLDQGKLCQAIQNTSKVVSGKPGPNQPVSVFEDAILGVLTQRELEALGWGGQIFPSRPGLAPNSAASQNKKGGKTNLTQEPFFMVQSVQVMKLLGASNKSKSTVPVPSSNGKAPVVVQIFPLK